MCRFIETICIEGGCVRHAPCHDRRLNDTRRAWWGETRLLHVEDYIDPASLHERTRCRLTYGREVERVEYFPYHPRKVEALQMVEADAVDYAFKYADRASLDALFARRGGADDVLLVRHGLLTDTTIANIALLGEDGKWYTPRHPLLAGTHRRRLLDEGILHASDLPADRLSRYSRMRLFNAMLHWGEVELPVRNIFPPDVAHCNMLREDREE